MTPLSTADQAARLVWLIPSRPRAALSLKAVVNRSSMAQSLVGCVSKASFAKEVAGVLTVTGRLKILVLSWPKLVTTTLLPLQFSQTFSQSFDPKKGFK